MPMTDDTDERNTRRHDTEPRGTPPAAPQGAELPPPDSDAWDAALAAAFDADDAGDEDDAPGAGEILARAGGRDAHVHLRDASGASEPLVRATDGAAGRSAGRYRILGEIARGGVGVILKGRDIDLGRDLAMKVLRDEHAGNTELIQRFVEEAQIGGQLQHPGIVPVYELGVDEQQRPYFTMKLVRGETLARLLADRAAAGDERVRFLRIFQQVCDAMAYAHARGVVHRDLKPANILVGSFGEVQVVDWGFAKVLTRGGVADERAAHVDAHVDARDAALIATVRSGPSGMESQVGSVMGTPSYMPPEQALGKVDALDERTDVFALGAILCEIVTGKPPYVGESIAQTALAAQRADLADALERLDACGAERPVIELAKACLCAEPSARPRDAGKLAAAVAAYLQSLERRAHDAEVEAARVVERAQAERRARRQRTIFIGCAAAALALALGGFVWLRARDQDRVHRIETAIHTAIRKATEHAGRGDHDRAALALERARTLAAAPRVDRDLVAQVKALTRESASRHRDAALVADLDAIRSTDDQEPGLADEVYVTTFAGHGIDIGAVTPEDLAGRTGRDTPLARAVAFALDDWVFRMGARGGVSHAQTTRLLALAGFLDRDPWRAELRSAAAERDAERLLALAAGVTPASVSPGSLDTLALALRRVRETPASIDLLRAAARAHPDDFYLHFHLSMLLARTAGEDDAEALEHAHIALALRPESIGTRLFLARHLAFRGNLPEARRYLDEALALDPTGLRPQVMRTLLLMAEGDAAGALAVVEELLLRGESLPPLNILRAALLVRLGETARAREALRSAFAAETVTAGEGGPPRRGRRGLGGPGLGLGGGPGPRGTGPRRPRAGDLDTNGDARIDRAETPAALRPLFDVLDRDGDGSLDAMESWILFRLDRELRRTIPEKAETKTERGRDQG